VNWTLTMYSTPSCRYCHTLMKQLDSEKVEYTSVDIERDSAAAETIGWIDRPGQVAHGLVGR